jgi:1-acylglycerone phosphate reductase
VLVNCPLATSVFWLITLVLQQVCLYPISPLPEDKKIFDVNVWPQLAVTQAFLPLLLKSKGMIVNQTSVVSTTAVPFQSAYGASKTAMAIFSDSMRLE